MNYCKKNNVPPVLLVVLDGWGIAPDGKYNAITQAKTPNFDFLSRRYPFHSLAAAGSAVGLIDGVIGNSEVGHMNLGAGRVVVQDLVHINRTLEDGTFFNNRALISAMKHAKEGKKKLHVLGMLSNKGIHTSLPHLFAILEMAKKQGVKDLYVHGFLDGRDSAPTTGINYLEEVMKKLDELGVGQVASLSGRYYAMDRADRWERSAKLYHALVSGEPLYKGDPRDYVKESYARGVTDTFIEPMNFTHNERSHGPIESGDAIIFWHLRSDRARQITKFFVQEDFTEFPRGSRLKNLHFVALTDFGSDLDVETAFITPPVTHSLPAVLSQQKNLVHMYLAESEKFPHVTYFFHGSNSDRLPNEDIVRVESPNVKSYAMTPTMSADKLTDIIEEQVTEQYHERPDFMLVNYSNADVVGHTGDFKKTVQAVECIDKQLGRLYEMIKTRGGSMIITADHGNAEDMYSLEQQRPNSSHTSNNVPCIIISTNKQFLRQRGTPDTGALANVAPTVLELLHIDRPKEMTHESLLSLTKRTP